jgi:hypothetical protein
VKGIIDKNELCYRIQRDFAKKNVKEVKKRKEKTKYRIEYIQREC